MLVSQFSYAFVTKISSEAATVYLYEEHSEENDKAQNYFTGCTAKNMFAFLSNGT